jgi:hypothetical protein
MVDRLVTSVYWDDFNVANDVMPPVENQDLSDVRDAVRARSGRPGAIVGLPRELLFADVSFKLKLPPQRMI